MIRLRRNIFKMQRLILITSLCIGCINKTSENRNEVISFDTSEFFSLSEEYIIQEDSIGTNIFGFAPDDFLYRHGGMYVNISWGSQIVYITPPFTGYTQIGKNGLGPGEYANPAYMVIEQNNLFYSDKSSGLIKSLPLRKDPKTTFYSLITTKGSSKFAVSLPYIALIHDSNPAIHLYKFDDVGNAAPVEEFMTLEPHFEVLLDYGLGGGGILFDRDKDVLYLYCITDAPYKILVYNVVEQNGITKVELEKELNMVDQPWYKNWSEQNYSKFSSMNSIMQKTQYMAGSYTAVEDFAILYDDTKSFFFVQLVQYNVSAETGTQRIFQVIDNEGTILGTYTGNMKFLDSEGGKVYFYNFKDNNKPLRITEYHFESEPPTDLN